jgi:hypothetical protein
VQNQKAEEIKKEESKKEVQPVAKNAVEEKKVDQK